MKPLVLVTTDIKTIDAYHFHAANSFYLNALARVADAQPVLLPSLGPETDYTGALSRVDGVLVTGTRTNVHPKLYGEDETEDHEPFDHDRDATTLELIRQTVAIGKPLLAICRGHQELNVAFGGSLSAEMQNLEGRFDHRAPPDDDLDIKFGLTHEVTPEPGELLASIVGPDPIKVNSYHRQAINRVADALQVEATADDGTIEAVSVTAAKAFALGLQWHPEYWAESEAVSQAIFKAFGAAIREGGIMQKQPPAA